MTILFTVDYNKKHNKQTTKERRKRKMKLYKVERNILNWIVYHQTILLIVSAIGILIGNTVLFIQNILNRQPQSIKNYFNGIKEDYAAFPNYQIEYAQDRREWLENKNIA